jgi:hypothetical protein
MHTPPGAKLIPLSDNTDLDPPPLAPPTQFTMDDDDDTSRGMAQTTVPYTDRILKAMDCHILNRDMLKARRSTKGPEVANIGEASIQSKLRRPAVNPWTILLSVLKTRTSWRATS